MMVFSSLSVRVLSRFKSDFPLLFIVFSGHRCALAGYWSVCASSLRWMDLSGWQWRMVLADTADPILCTVDYLITLHDKSNNINNNKASWGMWWAATHIDRRLPFLTTIISPLLVIQSLTRIFIETLILLLLLLLVYFFVCWTCAPIVFIFFRVW